MTKAFRHYLRAYTSLLKWEHSRWTTAVNNVSIWTQHMSVDISGPFFDHYKYKLHTWWHIDKGVRCPLMGLHIPSPVLGTVPESCLCRDLELDCDRAQLPDIPLVAVNVTMMWVRNLFFLSFHNILKQRGVVMSQSTCQVSRPIFLKPDSSDSHLERWLMKCWTVSLLTWCVIR